MYELPKTDSIVQIQKAVGLKINKSIHSFINAFIAHRLWFYLGGNLRAFRQLDLSSLTPKNFCSKSLFYFLEEASNYSLRDFVKIGSNKESKHPHFK